MINLPFISGLISWSVKVLKNIKDNVFKYIVLTTNSPEI